MRHSTIFTGSSVPVNFRIDDLASFNNFRLDVIVYSQTNDILFLASTHPEGSFIFKIPTPDDHSAVLVIPGAETAKFPQGHLTFEERYTHMLTGHVQIFQSFADVRLAPVGMFSTNLKENAIATNPIQVERKIGYYGLSSYQVAVLGGFSGTEQDFLGILSSSQSYAMTPWIQLEKQNGERLFYQVTNANPSHFKSQMGQYRIALRRYGKGKRIVAGKGPQYYKRHKMTDDSTTFQNPLEIGDPIPHDLAGKVIFWTDISISPHKLPEHNNELRFEFPYTAKEIFHRYVYFVDENNCLADIKSVLDKTPEDASKMIRVTGIGKTKMVVGLDTYGRTKLHYSINCDLVLFREQKWGQELGLNSFKRMFSNSVAFRVCMYAWTKVIGGEVYKHVEYTIRLLSNKNNLAY